MILTLLIYLLISVPVLMAILAWRVTGDRKAGWALPRDKRDRFLWGVIGFALSLPLFLSGLGCSLFNIGAYVTSTVGRATGTVRGDNYDIIFLFALLVSLPMGLGGYFGLRVTWRRLKHVLLNQPPVQAKDDF